MSFSLAVKDGDLALNGSSLAIVYGVDKLKQDVSIWLKERYRSDRFNSNYGSVLDSYIGQVIDDSTVSMVQGEVIRVLQNYQALQVRLLREHPDRLSADEVLVEILDIKTVILYDTVLVTIAFATGSNQVAQVSLGIGT